MSYLTVLKNVFANLCRGGAVALVTLLLPPFLTKILAKDAYGTWLLILQLSTYVSFLDFGIQTAVGRFVAHCNELGDTHRRDRLISTSLAILTGAALLGTLGMTILAWQLPELFPEMPAALHHDAQLALAIVGISLSVSLPFTVFGAIFAGIQRYDVPAWIIGISKLIGGIGVVLVARSSHSIVMMAVVMGLANLGTGLGQFIAYKKLAGSMQISIRLLSQKAATDIFKYCFALAIWSVGIMLVSGLDTAIVGYYDYKSVAYYTLAASLTSFVIGVQNSILTLILPNAAAIGARGDRAGLGKLLLATTRYATIVLILTSLPLILGAHWILMAWVGASYAVHTTFLLQLLVVANFIRQLGSPYAITAIAVGEQQAIVLSPLIEGAINLTVSVILTSQIGVVGVAIGTIVGSIVSVGLHLFYNLPRTKSIQIEHLSLPIAAIARPLIAILPGVLYLAVVDTRSTIYPQLPELAAVGSVLCLTVGLLYMFAISDPEKIQLNSSLRRRFTRSDP
jgi:O-antigen/teichoic acid export membrane protein